MSICHGAGQASTSNRPRPRVLTLPDEGWAPARRSTPLTTSRMDLATRSCGGIPLRPRAALGMMGRRPTIPVMCMFTNWNTCVLDGTVFGRYRKIHVSNRIATRAYPRRPRRRKPRSLRESTQLVKPLSAMAEQTRRSVRFRSSSKRSPTGRRLHSEIPPESVLRSSIEGECRFLSRPSKSTGNRESSFLTLLTGGPSGMSGGRSRSHGGSQLPETAICLRRRSRESPRTHGNCVAVLTFS